MMTITLVLIGTFLAMFPPKAHAIIILPALILIPLAQLLAVIISAISVPALSVGIIIAKMKKNHKLAIAIPIILVVIVGLIAAAILRWKNPHNPWF